MKKLTIMLIAILLMPAWANGQVKKMKTDTRSFHFPNIETIDKAKESFSEKQPNALHLNIKFY